MIVESVLFSIIGEVCRVGDVVNLARIFSNLFVAG